MELVNRALEKAGNRRSLRRERVIASERASRQAAQLEYLEELEATEAQPVIKQPDQTLIVPPQATFEQLNGLGYLAALTDQITADERSAARLAVLRLFGGWSLEDIAQHDNRSLAALSDEWAAARTWLATRAASENESGAVGRIITLDLCDLSVIDAIGRNPTLLRTLNWRAFERLLARVLEELGYAIELQRGTKDGGIDIFALKTDTPFGPHRYIIQAKRWANTVGVEAVRELLFLRRHFNVTKACLATTSKFSRGAWQLAREYRWELELRDFESLQEWLTIASRRL